MNSLNKSKLYLPIILIALFVPAPEAVALDRPWISDTFFYWYTWDYDRELGSWIGGIHNTPLSGYYDSRTLRDNRRSLWQASEWGLTHHFMDYWSPDWKGEGGQMREAVVMQAAESLRKAGYDIWMSYYQDGTNFEMREFSRNVSEKRDVHQWLRDFSRSEVWPKIDGKPLQLVYSRNGSPQTTIDHAGFRRFIEDRYQNVEALNREWGTQFGDFAEIEMSLTAQGHQRAASVEYQYRIWQREWEKLDELVREEFDLPGMLASFDVGYQPYAGLGFANFARVFGGPHSYAGIFGPPHDQDAQRFIQAAVAKKYDTVFFDHFKNYYYDWDIRVPGIAYLPDPFHFDRFWVGALARHSEALLHLSWNEWWEGSNLEPCYEFGKTYCEKNLFYATLMKLAFESIRTAGQGAPVAVLLNDWRFASGEPSVEELYGLIQILRRLNVPFDLLVDDFVTAERLKNFRLVVAPTFGCGLGYNRQRQPILDVLAAWLKGGDRRLILSAHPSMAETFGLREVPPPKPEQLAPGDDLNVFVDVATEGDEEFLRGGFSQAETGMQAGEDTTFRWTPGSGRDTSLLLPASPGRDHLLRIGGIAIWSNTVTVLINGREAATLEIAAGGVNAQAEAPAAMIGTAPMIRMQLRYAKSHVPGKVAPEQYTSEQRVCNLALHNVQWSTANVAANTPKPQYTLAKDAVHLSGKLFGKASDTAVSVPFRPWPYLAADGAETWSVRRIGRIPRDLALPFGPSQVLYVNGMLCEIEAEAYWLAVLQRWAGIDFHRFAVGKHCLGERLHTGDTDFVVCFNEDVTEAVELQLSIPERDLPLSEARVLSRDGRMHEPLTVTKDGGAYRARDALGYYGVYQFAFSPVSIKTPPLVLQPGQSGTFSVQVTNLTAEPVRGQLAAACVVPTITGEPIEIVLEPRETKRVPVKINAAPTVDWGRKTVYFNLIVGDRRAVVLRELIVSKPAEVELERVILDARSPQLQLRVPENPYGQTAALSGARLTWGGQSIELPTIEAGDRSSIALPPLDLPVPSQAVLEAKQLRIDSPRPHASPLLEREVFLALRPKTYRGPADATAAMVVFNARSKPLRHELLSAKMNDKKTPYCVRSEDGKAAPSQIDATGQIRFLADVPARSPRTFYLCRSEAEVATDLRCTADGLGSGKGTLKIENSQLSVTLCEAAGGTVTSLRSQRTGREYGRNSFGVNYGTFSRHDPAQPLTNTVKFINESKTRQEDAPGQIEIVRQGPAAVIARVRWADRKVQVEQTYEFPAYRAYFVVRQKVQPIDLDGQQELVAFNAQLQPNGLTKSYPNFVGVVNDAVQPHFGWRYGTWVPDYATLMMADPFDESVSLVVTRKRGLNGIRQGFYPAKRPQPGKCDIAQVELLADTSTGCDAEIYVLLHQGHQIVAKQFLADLRNPPRIDVVEYGRQ